MAPQDASTMQLYSAMSDVAPFLFIVFQRGELLAVFQFHGARALGKAFIPGGLQSFVFLPLHRPTVSTVPVYSWKHLETRRGGYLHVSTMITNA